MRAPRVLGDGRMDQIPRSESEWQNAAASSRPPYHGCAGLCMGRALSMRAPRVLGDGRMDQIPRAESEWRHAAASSRPPYHGCVASALMLHFGHPHEPSRSHTPETRNTRLGILRRGVLPHSLRQATGSKHPRRSRIRGQDPRSDAASSRLRQMVAVSSRGDARSSSHVGQFSHRWFDETHRHGLETVARRRCRD